MQSILRDDTPVKASNHFVLSYTPVLLCPQVSRGCIGEAVNISFVRTCSLTVMFLSFVTYSAYL